MPDYHHKNIPVLDDIIEDESDSTMVDHEKIIISNEIIADDNALDLFNDATANIELEQNEPDLGTIEKCLDDETRIDLEASAAPISETPGDKQPANETEMFESALIDYSQEDRNEENVKPESDLTTGESDTGNSDRFDQQNDQSTDIIEASAIAEPTNTLDLDAIIDDVISQVMPSLEQTLRSRLKQALQEQLVQDSIEPTASE